VPTTASASIDRQIGAIAIPAALALATEPLAELCDTAIVGTLGTTALGGVAIAVRVVSFASTVFIFLMFATTTAVARHLGAGDARRAAHEAVTAMWIALAIGATATVTLLIGGPTFISWLGGSGEVARDAGRYLEIVALSAPGSTLTMAGIGARRGHLDTRIPLLISAVAAATNLVADLILVIGLGFGIATAAWTTTATALASGITYVVLVVRDARRAGAPLVADRRSLRTQLVVGRDLLVRTVALRTVLTVATALAARQGEVTLAAYAIAFQIWIFCSYALDGLEAAGQSLVSHRLGSATFHELGTVTARLFTWGVRVGVALAVGIVALSWWLPRVFSSDQAVIDAATTALWWVAAFAPVSAVAFVGDGMLVGASRQRFLAATMLIASCAFGFVAWAAAPWGLAGIWAAISAMMVVRTAGAALGISRLRTMAASAA